MTIPVTHYADVRVTGDGVPQIVGTLIGRLHGFMESKGVKLGVAFPKYKAGERPKIGEVIRLFGDRDVLDALLDDWEGDERERWMCGRVKETPECERWALYQRVALPSRFHGVKRARFPDYAKERAMKKREKALEDLKELPFFFVRSQSGNTHFPFTVEKRIVKDASAETVQGKVNAYGFSTKSPFVPLPEF
ncbi:type I-F CRISPR-associated endoribonuclease Cas6/Csy4 [Acidithiobacillus thiooxidans]|uniref:Type I-F CRISPR-associated endoribonuclease Cas6/Csy4 n=1 Tax=Acidithiobacillus sulfurivorans TaxID=1958756 RepID=A0ABS5ZYT9_9PROT|nr:MULTISPECIES: type I-F CRISPR-associated endoribonuclease Cas6/Csy4 [Acidithiobacillus]MBU2760287.1 type I-F CRISPR-associated endoribonuclease Cas6/Csy4 [Acidithiobacillus sulfurivorans]MBU2792730.1 type I-F CRISPR-associated endoribonuclease Cas6/Csy4 [Acidithiobacillus thiooxidans]